MQLRRWDTGSATIRPQQFNLPDGDARPKIRALGSQVRRCIARCRQWLLAQQHPDGHWCAELQGDTILESETILLLAFLGEQQTEMARPAAAYILQQQLPEGGWAKYPGGSADVNVSVKAYFALKLTGHDPSAEYMQRARAAILSCGGADAVNSYTRYYLAMLGQISYQQCPAVPPEVMLLPNWFPASLTGVSAWSRTIIVPLSIVSAFQPVRQIEPHLGIRELFLRDPQHWPPLRCPGLPGGTGLLSWDRFFRTVDRLLRWCQRNTLTPLRRRAVAAARGWLLEHFQGSDGPGAIYPPIVWGIVALHCLGYPAESPEMLYLRRQLEELIVEDPASQSLRIQPCKSPVWDTAISVRALAAAGVPPQATPMQRAIGWLLDHQIRRKGDWSAVVDAEPGGWCFEYHNDYYPDNDDTAMVLMALRTQFDIPPQPPDGFPGQLRLLEADGLPSEDQQEQIELMARCAEAIDRGLRWLLAMQNDDGGWGAFDRNNNRQFLCYVPFADHNAMIDPSTPDLTGRVLQALGKLGLRVGDPVVDRAVDYLRRAQQPDGSWFGRWGVNYIYGTWQVISGLTAVGISPDDPAVVAGRNWLLAYQQPCGGWGESPDSYEKSHCRGQGPVTASQTAWAIMGLIAAGLPEHPAVMRGVEYLVRTQKPDGTWDEPEFTGTGFPRVFYLRYDYYRIYFPLMSLGQWASATAPTPTRPQPHTIQTP